MRRGTSAASFRRHQSIQLALASQFIPNPKSGKPQPERDRFQYTAADPRVPFFVVGQKATEKIAA
jgi:hypothetical protein